MANPVIGTPWKKLNGPVSEEELKGVDRYWRAANYLSVGQIYLRSNPLMREGFSREDVKHRLVGHWGTTPGINFLFGHINRLIADHQQNAIFLMGPGHGGPAGTAQSLLDGTYREVRPDITDDEAGLQKFFRQFSYPGGIPSHYAPETPGSIHEGGELGYTLSHAYGAVLDNPSLLAVAVVGDGEAETGPLATSWQTNKFMDPLTDGIVLPILHLNGYKIANPTILARISDAERDEFFRGMGYHPYNFVAGFDNEDHSSIHRRFAALLEAVFDEICDIKARVAAGEASRPFYPMIVFRTPKGWTCPKEIDGKKTEGSWRAHQVPLASARDTEEHFQILKGWMESYRPEELFDENGAIRPEVNSWMPTGELRIGANPNANGGTIRNELTLPDTRKYEVPVAEKGHGFGAVEATRVLGEYTAELINNNRDAFRIFGPDETASNRLQPSYQVTDKQWFGEGNYDDPANDEHLSPVGNVIEQLSEHQCEGLLEGYILTGRNGLWSSYESFVHIVDSMVNQHCKWLEATVRHIDWRKPISGLNMLLSSHVWRQDHNGFSHQDPGFVDVLLNKNFNNDHVVNIYYPADANLLLAVAERAYASTNCVNAIFAGKQPAPRGSRSTRRARSSRLAPPSGSGPPTPPRVRSPTSCSPAAATCPPARPMAAARPARQARRQGAPGQRGRPSQHPERLRERSRHVRREVRRALHGRQAGSVCVPRLSRHDPPPHLGPSEPRQLQRSRLPGAGFHDHAVRHGPRERHGPLGPCRRCPAHDRRRQVVRADRRVGELPRRRVPVASTTATTTRLHRLEVA